MCASHASCRILYDDAVKLHLQQIWCSMILVYPHLLLVNQGQSPQGGGVKELRGKESYQSEIRS